MSKKLIAFDLDGTLAPSKSPLPDRIALLLSKLLDKFNVCVISGGNYTQFEKQILSNLKLDKNQLSNLHLMPTCGTKYYIFDDITKKWVKVYSEDIPDNDKKRIVAALNVAMTFYKYYPEKVYGELIEDRGSQITLSTLGQDIVDVLGLEGVDIKEKWDPDNVKKNNIRNYAAELIQDYEVKVGGLTSIDVTKPGIDKAYGMTKLMDQLGITKEDILFIGDRLAEGGNDYPVKAMGIDSLEISHWQETAVAIEAILYAG